MRELLIIFIFLFLNYSFFFIVEGGMQNKIASRLFMMLIYLFGMIIPNLIKRLKKLRLHIENNSSNNTNNTCINKDSKCKDRQLKIDNYINKK